MRKTTLPVLPGRLLVAAAVLAAPAALRADSVKLKNGLTYTPALVVKADPAIGLEKDTAFILDLHEGVCRKAWLTEDMAEAEQQPFCITGNYGQWKQVIRKELDPIRGMIQGKLKLKGNLPVIVRFVKAAQELVNATSVVDTHFLDE